MINRLKYLMDRPPEPGRETTFYEVETVHNIYVVTLQGALEIQEDEQDKEDGTSPWTCR